MRKVRVLVSVLLAFAMLFSAAALADYSVDTLEVKIWDNAVKLMKIYDDSKTYIVNSEVEAAVTSIKAIIYKDNPFSDIYKLPDLIDKFRKAYATLVKAEQEPVLKAINDARTRVFDELNKTHCKEKYTNRVVQAFDEIHDKATHCNEIAKLKSIRYEAEALKMRLLNEIQAEENKILAQLAAEQAAQQAAEATETETPVTPAPKLKKRKSINIKSLNSQATWQIESREDIQRYLQELERKLNSALEEDTIINIEF